MLLTDASTFDGVVLVAIAIPGAAACFRLDAAEYTLEAAMRLAELFNENA